MAFSKTLFYGEGEFEAADDRLMPFHLRTEGVGGVNDLAVTQRGAGPNWSIDVATGWGFINGDDIALQGQYSTFNDATVNVLLSTLAPITHPRVDLVVLRFYDSEIDNLKTPLDQGFVSIIPGVETAGADGSNKNGAPAVPPTAIPLAYLALTTASVSVVNASIVSARRVSGPKVVGEDGQTYRLGVDSGGHLGIEQV